MASLISNLTKSEQRELFKNLFYLNTAELYSFCDSHSIPYRIMIGTEDGKLHVSRDKDRKKVVIERVTHFLKTGKIPPPTIFKKEIVRLSGLPENFSEKDLLYYGCYEKKNSKMISLLKELANGRFQNGAIARIKCRDFWSRGEAPTFAEYAKVWLLARDNYSLDQHPEAAFLTDRAKGTADENWKKLRRLKAGGVRTILDRIISS